MPVAKRMRLKSIRNRTGKKRLTLSQLKAKRAKASK